MSTRTLFCLLFLLIQLLGCQGQGQMRGLVEDQYISTSRPSFAVSSKLPLLGCEKRLIKLADMGVMGGLGIETWITVYGQAQGPMAIVAHADLPRGWKWDANLSQPFNVHEDRLYLGDLPFFAQTFLSIPGKNPFVAEEAANDGQAAKEPERWIIRSFSQRFNDDSSKIILEYRERLPKGVTSLTSLPYGHSDLIKDFARRAEACFTVSLNPKADQGIHFQTIPVLRSRYLDSHFFGTASPVGPLRVF
ncbi:MAG: DUF4851 domain-containing protein [Desulfovibrio sp.]|nr:DUF4851 domain-containing protein [Desulfovibrio sp.]